MINYCILWTSATAKGHDYDCFEIAAKSFLAGKNPYAGCYLYPPLFVESMAAAYKSIDYLASTTGMNITGEGIWELMFYLFQCLQFVSYITAYYLCYIFARKASLKGMHASIIVTILFLFNYPVNNNMFGRQINLMILDAILIAILLAEKHPFLSGLSLAIGGNIKYYPFLLLYPWGMAKRMRILAYSGVLITVIFLITSSFGSDLNTWYRWRDYVGIYSKNIAYNDVGLYAITYNISRAITIVSGMNRNFSHILHEASYGLLVALTITWFSTRFIARKKASENLPKPLGDRFRLFGDSIDAVCIGLLIFPEVLSHHYVFTIPAVIWAIAVRGDRRGSTVLSAILMFWMIDTNILLVDYSRIVGLLIVLHLTSPKAVPKQIDAPYFTQNMGPTPTDSDTSRDSD
ncbi:MAG: glycosyltransferase family 87 protein [Candidatus Altiarchaeota archaeon]